jgi:hypothetical protein
MGESKERWVGGNAKLRNRLIIVGGSVEDVKNGVCSTHVVNKDAYRISVGKTGG